MKKATKFLFAALILSLGFSANAFAQDNGDDITVTFQVNTATVTDTLTADNGLIQLRGAINGEEGDVNWGDTSVALQNVGGDYWQVDLTLSPGDTVQYKYWAGFAADTSAANGGDWEGGDNRMFTVPTDQTENMQYESFFNRVELFEAKEDTVGIYFRVNLAGVIQDGDFDHDADGGSVGLRGADPYLDWGVTHVLERDGDTDFYSGVLYANVDTIAAVGGGFEYKYVFGTGDAVSWEDGDNKQGMFAASDTTTHWTYFNGNAPTDAERVATEIRFAVNVDVLESIGLFDFGVGDEVSVPGGYNGWDNTAVATFNPSLFRYELLYDRVANPVVVGSDIVYKYFIRWDESRFDSDSDNYIADLESDLGWEEPGITGGADRVYTVTDQADRQDVFPADPGYHFYNGISGAGYIDQSLVDGEPESLPVTFRVDMTNALAVGDEISDAEDVFDPSEHELFILFEEQILAFTQDIPTGQGAFEGLSADSDEDNAFLDKVRFSPVDGEDNIYELTLDLQFPTVNSFGFRLAWGQPLVGEGTLASNGGGFSFGRRYYQFIEPLEVNDVGGFPVSSWPSEYVFNTLEFKGGENTGGSNLTVEDAPDYGQDTSIRSDESTRPESVSLKQNYPNPFNPTTNIAFTLTDAQDVTLTVYNVLGQRVATLVNTQLNAGTHTFTFDASRLSSGMYIYRLNTGNTMLQKQMMLIK